MAHATLSMIGLYRYDPTIFDEMTLPTGIDKDLAINSILMRCGEQEVVYADPNFLKSAIGVWADKHYFTFDKWKKALDEEFNPLYNYDRHEEYTDNRVVNENDKNQNSNSEITHEENKADSETKGNAVSNGATSNNSTVNDNTSAYDSSGYQPKDQTITNGSGTTADVSQTDNNTKSGYETDNSKNGISQNDRNRNMGEVMKHDAHLYGNIGVTTSVQMLKEYVGFYKDFNLYEQIAGLFADDFVIGIF